MSERTTTSVTVTWDPLDQSVTTSAPYLLQAAPAMVKVGYPANGQQISACHECGDWSCFVDVVDGEVMVYEWHRFDCGLLPFIRLGSCHGKLGPGEYCADCGTYNPNES